MFRVDFVATHASANPNGLALVDLESGRRWTYAQLHASVGAVGEWLLSEHAVRGVRVATLAKNCAEMVILHLAAARGGAIFVPLNWRLAAKEIEALVEDAQPALLLHDPDRVPPAGAGRNMPITELLQVADDGWDGCPPHVQREFEETSLILYTSGTSGKPKGVMLSESNLFWGALNFIYGYQLDRSSVALCDMPLFHTAGLNAITRATLQAGGSVLIARGFDAPKTLQRLTDPELGVTHYMCVPQMAMRLWNEPGFEPEKLQKLVAWAVGGAPSPRAQVQRFVEAGIRVSDGFGMSETCSNFGMPAHDLEVLMRKAGSCGLPFMALDAKIADDTGQELRHGETGELWVRGPCVSSGYWNQPEITAKAFQDGWFRTGDAALRDDDGFYYIVDRRKDMYISGGENVYPAEVEAVIAEISDVAECAVIGVPDETWGEVGRVYVVPAPGHTITVEQVLQHCASRLAGFKQPRSVVVTDVLPRTASGKVQKHLLKLRAAEEDATGE